MVKDLIISAISIVSICVSCISCGSCNGAASTLVHLKSLVCELLCEIKIGLFVRICYLIVNSSGCFEVECASELADLFEAIVIRVRKRDI